MKKLYNLEMLNILKEIFSTVLFPIGKLVGIAMKDSQ